MYVKLIGNNHGSFPYKLGINRLLDNDERFDPRPLCNEGGLYYCELKYMPKWFDRGETLCVVKPGDGARVVSIDDNFKTDVLEIMEMMPLTEVSTWEFILKQEDGLTSIGISECLGWAIKHGHDDIFELLFSRGDPLLVPLLTDPMREAANRDRPDIFIRLLEKGGNINDQEPYVFTCIRKGRVDTVKFFTEKGFSSFAKPFTRGYLAAAAKSGSIPMVDFLLDKGLSLKVEGESALICATMKGHFPLVKHLVAKGVAITDNHLIEAACHGYDDILIFLLESGAPDDMATGKALAYAASGGHLTTAKLLVEAGANLHLKRDRPLRWAVRREHDDVADYLRSLGLVLDEETDGDTDDYYSDYYSDC